MLISVSRSFSSCVELKFLPFRFLFFNFDAGDYTFRNFVYQIGRIQPIHFYRRKWTHFWMYLKVQRVIRRRNTIRKNLLGLQLMTGLKQSFLGHGKLVSLSTCKLDCLPCQRINFPATQRFCFELLTAVEVSSAGHN